MVNNEFRLVALLSLLELTPEIVNEIKRLLQGDINFTDCQQKINQHRTWPLVYSNIKKYDFAVPEAWAVFLQKKAIRITDDNLQFAMELKRLVRIFSQQNIPLVSLKGIVLTKLLYQDYNQRHSRDLDLLIPSGYIHQAHNLLVHLGYRHLDSVPIAACVVISHHACYEHECGIEIELHWRLDRNKYALCFQQNTLWQEMNGKNDVFGHTLDNESLLLYLAWHGSQHYWERLKWLIDIYLLVNQSTWNWDALLVKAIQLDCDRALVSALYLCHQLYDLGLDQAIQTYIDHNPLVQQLAEDVIQYAFNNTGAINILQTNKKQRMWVIWKRFIYKIKLGRSWAYKSIVGVEMLRPGEKEFNLISLPERFFFIYYFIRPIRVIYSMTQDKYLM